MLEISSHLWNSSFTPFTKVNDKIQVLKTISLDAETEMEIDTYISISAVIKLFSGSGKSSWKSN